MKRTTLALSSTLFLCFIPVLTWSATIIIGAPTGASFSGNNEPDDISVTNTGIVNGDLIGTHNNALGAEGGSNSIYNFGTVQRDILGNHNFGFGSSGGSNSIYNYGIVQGSIYGSNNDGNSLGGGSNSIYNFSTVQGSIHGSINWVSNSSGGSNSIYNFSTVQSFIYGSLNDGDGSSGGSNSIYNFSTVQGSIYSSYNLGIDSNGGSNSIYNYGIIQINIIGSYNWGSNSNGGSNSIYNYGTVQANIAGSYNSGDNSSSGSNSIYNYGTVQASIYGSYNSGSGSSGGDDWIYNSGTVNGSIFGKDGNDTIVLVGGSVLGGVADGGTGSDTLGFVNIGSVDGGVLGTTYLNFENLGIYGGTNILTGTWNFPDGTVTVYNGNLAVNGSLISEQMTVENGGLLGGTGTISSRIVNYGTISPGNSIGTLNINGSLSFMSGSNYLVELSSNGTSDQLNVNGPVTLSGGTVITAVPRGLYPDGYHWRILTASGGLSGRFAVLSDNLNSATLDLWLDYGSRSADLRISRTPYTTFGNSPNQQSVGTALDGIVPLADGAMAGLLTTMDFDMSELQIQRVLEGLNPEMYVDFPVSGLASAHTVDRVVSLQQYELRHRRVFNLDPVAATQNGFSRGWNLWTRALGGHDTYDGDDSPLGFEQQLAGFLVGADRQFADWLYGGVFVGYSDSDLEWQDPSHEGIIEGTHVGIYSGLHKAGFFVDVALGYADLASEANRHIDAVIIDTQAESDIEATVWHARLEGGYEMVYSNWLFSPLATLSYATYAQDGFREHGADLPGLQFSDSDLTSLSASMGMRFGGHFTSGSWQFLPRAELQMYHEFDTDGVVITANFSDYPSESFTISGMEVSENRLVAGLGVTAEYGNYLSLFADYMAEVADDYCSHLVSAGVSYRF